MGEYLEYYLKERVLEIIDWTDLAQDRHEWQAAAGGKKK
jgi:hypothetical protein